MTSEKKVPGDQDRARGRSKTERRKRTSSLAAAGGMANVSVIAAYQSGLFSADDLDILECRDEVVRRIRQVHDGNTVHVVGLLMAQALALNSIFTKLSLKKFSVCTASTSTIERTLRAGSDGAASSSCVALSVPEGVMRRSLCTLSPRLTKRIFSARPAASARAASPPDA